MTQDPLDRVEREYQFLANQARRETDATTGRIHGIYGALQNELAPMAGTYDAQAQQIAADLQGQMGGLAGLMNQAVPGAELQAGQGAFGAQGAGALGTLASDRGRNLAYATSAQRQGAIEPMVMGRRLQMELQDELAGLRDQQTVRLDELADQRLQQMLARREMQMRARQQQTERQSADAFRQFLLSQIEGQLNRGRGGGGGGRGRDRNRGRGR